VARRHFAADITKYFLLDAGYWWLILSKNTREFCRSCDNYKKIGGLKTKSLAKLVTTFPEKPFMKWGLDFMSSIKLAKRLT
jgi:hypothetical protein